MSSVKVLLRCPSCSASTLVKRVASDPPEAAVVELPCDKHCDSAAMVPKYFDGQGHPIIEQVKS